MNRLTTERLDELAAQMCGSDSEWWDCEAESRALIDAARLQVALDECDGVLSLSKTVTWFPASDPTLEWTAEGFKNGRQSVTVQPTPLAAVLALRDALREPR